MKTDTNQWDGTETRNKSMHRWSINLQQESQEHIIGKGNFFNKWS